MKYLWLLLAFLTIVPSTSRAEGSLFAVDKAAHFGLSFIATETGYAIGKKMNKGKIESWLVSTLIVNAVGIVKETAIDEKVDSKDILANALGSVSAGVFVWTFDF